jgi:hypothetical protein
VSDESVLLLFAVPILILQCRVDRFKGTNRRGSPTGAFGRDSIGQTVNQCRLEVAVWLRGHPANAACCWNGVDMINFILHYDGGDVCGMAEKTCPVNDGKRKP